MLRLLGSAIAPHAVRVTKINGELVFQQAGTGARTYQVPALKCGFYVTQVSAKGQTFKKLVTLL